ncbi:MAG: nucleotide pyrophosphohydrolase [Planctomycetes bacterium]|nr:nucleotide pyrophosphohydrolase [Planctomycetota bacterium]
MSDATTTIADLRNLVQQFVSERNWEQFHTPKNLAMSISIEAAELMELFQWTDSSESARRTAVEPHRTRLAEELADVLCYALSLANATGLDVSDAIQAKLVKNRQKYPADEFRDRFERP